MDAGGKRRMHNLMYGLYYPAVLGAGVVVALQRVSNHSMQGPQISVAITAGAFFSLSFASGVGSEDRYGIAPLILDMAEVIGMFYCLNSLGLIDFSSPIPRTVTSAYLILLGLVCFQLLWRKAVKLKTDAYLDLKLLFVLILAIGAFAGSNYPCLHWGITVTFSLLAVLYASNHPYDPHEPVRRWFFGKT